jgi:hypothetical protein
MIKLKWEGQTRGFIRPAGLKSSRYADKDFPFALVVGVLAIIRLMTGTFYEEVTATDIGIAYWDTHLGRNPECRFYRQIKFGMKNNKKNHNEISKAVVK